LDNALVARARKVTPPLNLLLSTLSSGSNGDVWISHAHSTIAGIVRPMHRHPRLTRLTRTGRVQLKGVSHS
jgi:hypothetical protein